MLYQLLYQASETPCFCLQPLRNLGLPPNILFDDAADQYTLAMYFLFFCTNSVDSTASLPAHFGRRRNMTMRSCLSHIEHGTSRQSTCLTLYSSRSIDLVKRPVLHYLISHQARGILERRRRERRKSKDTRTQSKGLDQQGSFRPWPGAGRVPPSA